jgi:hypothetical protein
MEPSGEQYRAFSSVTCYLDDSALDSNQPAHEHGVLGGVVFNGSGFPLFDAEWAALLDRYDIQPPLHMKEFTPHGTFSRVVGERRAALMLEVASAINRYKVHTICAYASNREHERLFSASIAGATRLYGLCYMATIKMNRDRAKETNFRERIAYVLDRGTAYANHVRAYHDLFKESGERDHYYLGPIAFESDDRVTALQAADVVAWTKRRLLSGRLPHPDFQPLADLFASDHVDAPIESDSLMIMVNAANDYLARTASEGASVTDRGTS